MADSTSNSTTQEKTSTTDSTSTTSATDQSSATTDKTKTEKSDGKCPDSGTKSEQGVSIKNMVDALGVDQVNGILGSQQQLYARQHLLNPKKYETEFKKPNPGKFPNNNDPFPVDPKIEELESHMKSVKLNKISTCECATDVAIATLHVGDRAEKRLVHLENLMATMMRYLFRLGARVPINCVYYGGQTPFEKYKCIRCLRDDRIEDGQEVQIDQCLCCTRYEPVFGQAYEIMNNLGASVANILDDNQMAYMNMKDYVDLERVERYHEEKDKGQIALEAIQTPSKYSAAGFSTWGKGLKMKWDLVPKEDQKCHINWRQSINDDGSKIARLASWPGNEANSGQNIIKDTNSSNLMQKNKDVMEAYKGEGEYAQSVIAAINDGKGVTGSGDDAKNFIQDGAQEAIGKVLGEKKDTDLLTVGSLCYFTKEDPTDLATKYKDICTKVGTDNPAVTIPAMVLGVEVILGKDTAADGSVPIGKKGSGAVPRIDKVSTKKDDTSSDSGGSSSSSNSSSSDNKDDLPPIIWDDRGTWLWTDIAVRLVIQSQALGKSATDLSMFPKVCYMYLTLLPMTQKSRFDTDNYAFPFTDKQMSEIEITYTDYYDQGGGDHRAHYGIDLACPEGTEFSAVHSGTVTADGHGWGVNDNALNIDHGDGTYSRYLHCSEIDVKVGDPIEKGQVIGKVGTTGNTRGGACLHLEISQGNPEVTTPSPNDPLDCYPKFKSLVKLGQRIPAVGSDS